MSAQIRIDVERFYTRYLPDPNNPGKQIAVDYVVYGPAGGLDRIKNTERVSRLASIEGKDEVDNPTIAMARLRWEAIRPRYEAWKAGREMATNGTPLSAWNLLQPEDVDMLRLHRVYTVEDVAALTDAMIHRIGLPNGRDVVRQAKLFLDSADRNKISQEADALRQRVAALEEQLKLGQSPQPKRGRPRKALPLDAEAATEAATEADLADEAELEDEAA
jgi:hypothetical protein